ncbi:MAG: hypothetical protein JXA18_10270, partial [Chitinispirillaceae bacterium]|nr:hypothetical protein [Chitinispirillaceae bacterium]
SDRKERSPSFFAAGPIVGVHLLVGLRDTSGMVRSAFGIKPFYTALFAENRAPGTVVGGALEYMRQF